jgi:hypothetical protein
MKALLGPHKYQMTNYTELLRKSIHRQHTHTKGR